MEQYAHFVNSAVVLSSECFTNSDLIEAEKNIEIAMAVFQDEFEESFMVCNTHLSLHAVECVRKTGPLWCTSTIPFESYISRLKKYCNGPHGIDHQIATKHLQIFRIDTGSEKMHSNNESVENFCKNLFRKGQFETTNCDSLDPLYFESFILENGQTAYKKQANFYMCTIQSL